MAPINSVDFSTDGDYVINASDDESIHIFDCRTGECVPCSNVCPSLVLALNEYFRVIRCRGTVYSKKYGVDLIRFVPNQRSNVLCASKNSWDETLRLLSLADNQYLRYFKGHRDRFVAWLFIFFVEIIFPKNRFVLSSMDQSVSQHQKNLLHFVFHHRVVSLAVCPKDETFASSALDNSVRLWDTRTHNCHGVFFERPSDAARLRMPLAYDPEGLVLAVGHQNHQVKLFDRRAMDRGPFMIFTLEKEAQFDWTSASFDATGRQLLLSSNTNLIVLFDAITGEKLQEYSSFQNATNRPVEASFSPGGEFVLAGSDDGVIHVWETLSGDEFTTWSGHKNPVNVVRWNPRMQMVRFVFPFPFLSAVCLKLLFCVFFVGCERLFSVFDMASPISE